MSTKWLFLTLCSMSAIPLYGQNSSLYRAVSQPEVLDAPMLPQASWTYIPLAQPKQIQLHDIVVVKVDELARMQSDGEINRRKTGLYNAQLKDWIFLRGLEAVKPDPQTDGDQKVQGQLQQQLRSTSELEARESLSFNIACEVIDIRPNGNLVLEGHKRVSPNEEKWEVYLSGMCRREDIQPDNVVLSRNIVDLQIDKRERGMVRDGYRRGWFLRWFDEWHPF